MNYLTPGLLSERTAAFLHVKWDSTIGIEGVAATVALTGALLGFWLNQRRSIALRRADLVLHYEVRFADDQAAWAAFMDIDYDRLNPSFSPDGGWLGADGERSLIRLLDLFNSLGHNWSSGALRTGDIQGTTLAYAIRRTARNTAVRRYLQDVDASDDLSDMGLHAAWPYFRLLAAALESRTESLPDI